MVGGSPFYSILQDAKRIVFKLVFIAAVVFLLGTIVNKATAQNCPQPTLVDNMDLSSRMITQKEVLSIEQDIRMVYNEIVLMEKTKLALEETLKRLYIDNPQDTGTIIALEEQLFAKEQKIAEAKSLIRETCKKMTGLTVIVSKGRRSDNYIYSGAQTWMHVQQDLWDAGY